MGDIYHYSLEDVKDTVQGIVDDSLKPFVGRVSNLEDNVFGEDWNSGIKAWCNQQNGYLRGIKTALSWGMPILSAINLCILAAVLAHIAGGG